MNEPLMPFPEQSTGLYDQKWNKANTVYTWDMSNKSKGNLDQGYLI